MKENKVILVTGATGLIGSHIVDNLMKNEQNTVVALSRNEEKLKNGFKEYLQLNNFKYIASDITEDIQDKLDGYKIDYIFHAASPMEGKVIQNFPVNVITPNLNGTINCLEILRKQKEKENYKGRLILFSSVTVYANATDHDVIVSEEDTNVTEKLDSISAAYSQAKRMSEVIAQAYRRQYDVDVVIARLSTVYGNTRFKPDTAFFQFINTALNHNDIIMNSSGIGRRDNIYIDDAVDGLIKICNLGENGQAYNISSNGDLGNYLAIDEIGQAIIDDVNLRGANVKLIYRENEQQQRKPGLRMDNSKLKKLGWDIQTNFKEGIHKTISEIIKENDNSIQ